MPPRREEEEEDAVNYAKGQHNGTTGIRAFAHREPAGKENHLAWTSSTVSMDADPSEVTLPMPPQPTRPARYAGGEVAVLELRSPTPEFSPPPPPRREVTDADIVSPPSPPTPPMNFNSPPPPPPAAFSRPTPSSAAAAASNGNSNKRGTPRYSSTSDRTTASSSSRQQNQGVKRRATSLGVNPTPKPRGDAAAADTPATMLGSRAAGTPTRTLRERVNQLEKEKGRLEADNRLKSDENAALRERLANLEAALLSDLDERIGAALEPTDLPSSPMATKSAGTSPRTSTGAAVLSSRPSESAAVEAAEARAHATLNELRYERERAEALQKDVETLESALQESEMQRRGFASRFAFCLLDSDHDGVIDCAEVRRYELFASYSESTMQAVWSQWDFSATGKRGLLTLDDFVLISNFAEDKNSKQSSAFWFAVADGDGDGYITFPDVKRMYELAVNGMPIDAAPSIGLDDLWCQLSDMAKPAHPESGIAVSDVRKSGLCFGFFGLLFNHHNMLGQRSTLEWSRHDYPL